MSEIEFQTLDEAGIIFIDGDRGKNYPKKSDFGDTGYCVFLNTSNVKKFGFDFTNTDFITKSKDDTLRKGKLTRGDIVLTTRGTIGNVAIYIDTIPYQHIRINSGMVIVRVDNTLLEPYFVYLFFQSDLFKKQIEQVSSGSAQPQLPVSILKNIKIPKLSKQQQHTIVQLIGNIDRKIYTNIKANSELESMAKTLYDYWFVQFDFPDENGKPYKSSGGKMVYNKMLKREIPKGWGAVSLYDLANFQNGLAMQKYRPSSDDEEYLPVIKIKEMRDGFTDQTEKASINVDEKVKINNGDILFSWSASLEVMIWSGGKGALNQHIFKVTSDSLPYSILYFQLMNCLSTFKRIAELRKTTMGHITKEHLQQFLVCVPPIYLMDIFEDRVAPSIQLMMKNNLVINELQNDRNALLSLLINGQVFFQRSEK